MPLTPQVRQLLTDLTDHPVAGRIARVLDIPADRLLADETASAALTGQSGTGHPLHPGLVHLPIGGAAAAVVLEIAGLGRLRAASTVVTGFTVLAALPSAAAGLADWSQARESRKVRRLGAVHAAVAATGTALSILSLLARVRGGHGSARLLVFGAAAAYTAAGFLGGDLVYGEPDSPDEE